tara:strand:- start:54 stop:524 length:471 start_codon:yes stop_codon:yes gene_type:complete
MKGFLSILSLIMLLLGCSNDEKDCCTVIDTAISIKYLNAEGENLFEVANGYKLSELTVYHNINGVWERYYEGNLDYPKGLNTVETDGGVELIVFPSTNMVENHISETKIQFSESDSDIIKSQIEKSGSTEIVTKVWYNNELKWENNQAERAFQIIK